MDEGASERQAVMPLALVITGAPNATLYVAESDDPRRRGRRWSRFWNGWCRG
jgi:hypothetical protein